MAADRQYVITYGTLDPRPCEVHGGIATRFGTLVDPNGHKWIICAECINGLWDNVHWLKLQDEAEAGAERKLAEKLGKMIMRGGD